MGKRDRGSCTFKCSAIRADGDGSMRPVCRTCSRPLVDCDVRPLAGGKWGVCCPGCYRVLATLRVPEQGSHPSAGLFGLNTIEPLGASPSVS